jgi:hypothetical protein
MAYAVNRRSFMAEQFDESPYIQDVDLAWEIAHAEKPGRDYLYDNPELPRRDVIAVAYEIGAAAMHAERQLTSTDPSFDFEMRSWFYGHYEYKTVPVPEQELKLKDSPLVAEWAQLPGMKLIDGRPVVGEDDMRAFTRRRIAAGESMNKGTGVEVYGLLHNVTEHEVEYIPDHPRYAMQQAARSLRFFDRDTAQEAGLEVGEYTTYVDLLSLYEFACQLPGLVRHDGKRWDFGLTASKASFLTSFMNDILHLEGSSDEA